MARKPKDDGEGNSMSNIVPLDGQENGVVSPEQPSALVRSTDPFERFEEAAQENYRGADVWEDMVALGIEYGDTEDQMRFKLGHLAALVGKKYGEDRLGEYANLIRKSKKSLQEWRQVWNYWRALKIAYFLSYPMLRYTHFRCAMRVGLDQEDEQAAYNFLRECVENDWSVGRAEIEADQRMGKHTGPKKIGEGTAKIVSIKGDRVTLKLANEQIQAVMNDKHERGEEVLVRVYESEMILPPEQTPAGAPEQAPDEQPEQEPEAVI